MPEERPDNPAPTARWRPPANLPTSALVVIVIALVVLVWLLFLRGDDGETDTEPAGNGSQSEKTVEVVSAEELPDLVGDVGYTVYWVGPRAGVDYEVTLIPDETYIRYLPSSQEPETPTPVLTVGSYRQEGATKVLQSQATENESETFPVAGGGSGYESAERTSVYVAFPGEDTQIEVYEPARGEARQLVESGVLVPVG